MPLKVGIESNTDVARRLAVLKFRFAAGSCNWS